MQYYPANGLGRSFTSPVTSIDQFVGHPQKNLPYNYSTANWVIERARQDLENPVLGDSFLKGDSLPAYSRFKFNLGRERPYSVVVNNRTTCIQGEQPDGKFCSQCTPHPYDMRSYAPYVAPQPYGERLAPTPMPVLPPYGDESQAFASRAGLRAADPCLTPPNQRTRDQGIDCNCAKHGGVRTYGGVFSNAVCNDGTVV